MPCQPLANKIVSVLGFQLLLASNFPCQAETPPDNERWLGGPPLTIADVIPRQDPPPQSPATGRQDEGLVCAPPSFLNPLNVIFCNGLNLCNCDEDDDNDNDNNIGEDIVNDENVVGEIIDLIGPWLWMTAVTEVPCVDQVTQFSASGNITFRGQPEEIGPEEISRLELVIKEIYNTLIIMGCDGYHRSVSSFQISAEFEILSPSGDNRTRTRNLQEEEEEQDFSTTYAVVGECRNCPVTDAGEFSMYDNDSFRRQLLDHQSIRDLIISNSPATLLKGKQQQPSRNLQIDNDDGCYCLRQASQNPPEPNAPQPEQLIEYSNAAIDTLEILAVVRGNAVITNITETSPP